MNPKTLILLFCITLISSHPVQQEYNKLYDYDDFDETEDCNFLNLLRDENKIYHFQFI